MGHLKLCYLTYVQVYVLFILPALVIVQIEIVNSTNFIHLWQSQSKYNVQPSTILGYPVW